ncbi:hypothetical protein H311_00477 [Anncaliia algerae PRA109]|nr:hypothetical protein H311_00477 [Anncaliia algerae PRA109]
MNIFQIGQLTSDPSKSFEFAIKLGLVSTKPKNCPKCNYQMRLEKGKIRHGLNIRWACGKKACRYKTSVFTNTIFHATHLQIGDVLRILYCFAIGCSLTNTTQYTDLNKKTVSGWFKFFRRI